ncbi:MAG TPA: hypothetical protein VM734_04640 [Kofleriaceae bacterium]|nr:hypothetical protein [Kofleriaceae bacterium]
MRWFLACLCAAAIGCAPRPPTRKVVRTQTTFHLSPDSGWLDRAAGVLELQVLCAERSSVLLCTLGGCVPRTELRHVACPFEEVEIRAPGGAVAMGGLAPSGRVRVTIDPGADAAGEGAAWSPDGWTVRLESGVIRPAPMAWDGPLDERGAPAATREVRRYRTAMLVPDTLVLSGGASAALLTGGSVVVGAVAGAAYLAVGPIVHAAAGNRRESARSLARRALLPLVAGAAGAGLGILAERGCADDCPARPVATGAGVAFGVLTAVVWDAIAAEREVVREPTAVAPVVSGTGDGVVVGVGGRF